jgi:predicted ATPase/DNA-binding SARP family transcriptional activator/Tfp pilus assembly protein PilF
VEIKRRKALALLSYLAVSGEPQPRDKLATLLWPESSQSRARKALRRDLSELNLTLEGDWLEAGRESVGLREGVWLDVTEFQCYLAREAADPQLLIAAATLYRDDFLTGFTLPGCPEFDEWQFFQTESLRQALARALERLVGLLRDQANYETAIPYARRRLALDPLHEPAHRQLMQLYAQAGQHAAALRQYEICCQTLEDELGISPALETTALFDDIRTGSLSRKMESQETRLSPAALNPIENRKSPGLLRVGKIQNRHNLPTQTTSFIGREDELAQIKRLLLDEPDCRLLNLAGPGGIGKTRLALAAATQTLESFPHGAYFVSLSPVSEVEYIVPTIAEALRFTFYGSTDPKDQLLDYLSQKQLLLVVDNFEHLLDRTDLLSDILSHAPKVTLLATSRERLNLREEWVFEVQGLLFPAGGGQASEVLETSEVLTSYSAVQLFLQRARQTEIGFTPSAAEMADIGRICQLVEGMPLGLELASSWIRTLSCREIAAEIERSLDFLTTPLRNMPERHRSLRVVFEQTWRRLSQVEQTVLMQLSVFRGGCTREAAERVTGATLPVLSSLVDRALLRRTNTGRYGLHELIRQFAEAQLQTDPQLVDQTRQRHRDFFITLLEARTAGVKGGRQFETLAEIEADIDNVRLAWRGAVTNRQAEAIERSAECLFVYYLYRNGYDEGQSEFRRAIAAFAALPDAQADDSWLQELAIPAQKQNLVGFLLAGLGYFLAHRRNLQKGQMLLGQALALLRRTGPVDRRKEAFALLWLGWVLYFQGQLIEGKRYARESLTLLTEAADHWGEGWALLLLGNCLRDGRPAEAAGVYQTGLTLCRESKDQIVLSYLSLNMGIATKELGHYVQAQPYIDQAVTINEKLDNILGLGYALFSRGRLEIPQGKYRQAITTLQQALTYFNKVGTIHASRAQVYLGLAHHLQGDYDLAVQLYGQALEGLKVANSKLELTRCLNGLGCLAYDQGKLHQAEQFQRESLALLQETEPEPALVAATLCYLGHVIVASGEHRQGEARDYFRQALELATEHQLAPLALDVCVGVARLRAQTGKREQAVELLALAARHEASTFETRERARQYLAELLDQLPSEVRQAARARGQRLDWRQTAKHLIDELQEQTIQHPHSTRRT